MPVAPLPATKVTQCSEEVDFPKVWAERFHEIKLAVGALPQHEVAETLLAGSSYDEVWIRLSLGVQALGDGLDGDALGEVRERATNVLVFLHESPDCLGDFSAPPVAHSQIDVKTRVPGAALRSASEGVKKVRG